MKELISNAFDAEATLVTMIQNPRRSIVIHDNGVGMDYLIFYSNFTN